jgi:hypothetical protein
LPLSAMPIHLNDPDEIENNFPDDSQYSGWFGKIYRWYNKKTKTIFAFSYRCTEWYAKWRKYPKVLFAVRGKGKWRYESEIGDILMDEIRTVFNDGHTPYLSRIQPCSKWRFAILWPLIINAHYLKGEVPEGQPYPDLDGRYWNFYINHFDNDLIFWMVTSVYIGANPK